MKANMTCGEAAIAMLERYGVDTVFGIPGVHTLDLYRGLEGTKIRHVGVRHEQGAGFMADGYARASGKPGVCLLITGPGLINAGTPIGQAFSDSVPMVVMSSVNAIEDLGKGRGRLHEITNQQAAIAPLVSASHSLRRPAELNSALADAYARFAAERPRPVHIEIPLDLAQMPAAALAEPPTPPRKPQPSATQVAEATKLILSSKRLFMIVGGGTVDCADAVRAFVAATGAAVVTTTAGKGVVADSDTRCLNASLLLPGTQKMLASADVVLAVGTEMSETDSWVDRLTIPGKLIRIDIDAPTLQRDYPPTVGLLADAAAALPALTAALAGRKPAGQIAQSEVEALRKANASGWKPLQLRHRKLLEALRRALPEDGMVASDMTQIAYTANYSFPMTKPRRWFHPVGFGTLGYALPAAIGAQIAASDRACLAIAGDAGFLFTVQDLATAVEQKLPIAILLWNNDALGQIAGDMIERGIAQIGVKPRNPDYLALARAFGARATRPTSLDGVVEAVRAAFHAEGPTLIEVHQNSNFLD